MKHILIYLLVLCLAFPCWGVDIWFDVDTAISEAPVNLKPLTASGTDIDSDVNYNEAGLVLIWNFTTTAGAYTQTAVTPTDTTGAYDWVEQGNGMFTIEIPASAGGSINNNTEGFGWFIGITSANHPWRGPVIGFRAAVKNDLEIEDGTAQQNQSDMYDGTGYIGGTIPFQGDLIYTNGVAIDLLNDMGDKIVADMDANSLLVNFTAARAGYLDNINNPELLNISGGSVGRYSMLDSFMRPEIYRKPKSKGELT